MTRYLILTALGVLLFLSAYYTDHRAITRARPAVIVSAIPRLCFVAKSLGMMISVAALGAAAAYAALS